MAAQAEYKDDGEASLALLFQSCSSIINTALSSSTIGNRAHFLEQLPDTTDDTLLRNEAKIQAWLDQQILDYRTALERRHYAQQFSGKKRALDGGRAQESSSSFKVQQSQQISSLRDSLFDESERMQRCQMLQSRIRMATIGNRILSPSGEVDPDVRLLHREALTSRDKQVSFALEKISRLDQLKVELQSASEECQKLQKNNRELWKEIHGTIDNDQSNASICSDCGQEEKHSSARLASENLILRRALLDIIVGSGVDWYSDKRIWKTMVKLEEA